MPDPMKPADIMAIANQAKPIDAQQVYSMIDSAVTKKLAPIQAKLDRIIELLETKSKSQK